MTKTDVRVNLIEPVATATRLREEAMPGEDQETLPKPDAITNTFVELASPDCQRNGEIVAAGYTIER